MATKRKWLIPGALILLIGAIAVVNFATRNVQLGRGGTVERAGSSEVAPQTGGARDQQTRTMTPAGPDLPVTAATGVEPKRGDGPTVPPEPALELPDEKTAPAVVAIAPSVAGGEPDVPRPNAPDSEVAMVSATAPTLGDAQASGSMPAMDRRSEEAELPFRESEIVITPLPQGTVTAPNGRTERERAKAGSAEAGERAPRSDMRNPRRPQFDLVRIDESGAGLLAGRAAPLAALRILVDGQEIGQTQASPRGEFVTMVETPLSDGIPQVIEVAAILEDASEILASDPVIVLGRAPEAAGAEDDAGPAAPLVVQSTDQGVALIRPQGLPPPQSVSLDAITYGDAAEVILVGRGVPGLTARVYIDDAQQADIPIGDDGAWRGMLSDVRPGVYTLRVDEVDGEGAVTSRIESPFQRVVPEPALLAEVSAGREVVIQPGHNLWTIAEGTYGSGFKYTVIYEANRDAIRDPDLIYPGQIFGLPRDE